MYLDVYLVCSSICNYMVLSCTLRRYDSSKRRRAAAALVGALGACLWEVWLPYEALRPVTALVLSLGMLRIVTGKRPRAQQGRDLLLLYMYAFLLDGLILFIQRYFSLWIGAVGVSYGLLRWVLRVQNQEQGRYLEMVITLEEADSAEASEVIRLKALVDSGHQLREPMTGRPVVVVSQDACRMKGTVPVCVQTVQGSTLLFGFWPNRLCIGNWEYKKHEVLVVIAQEWKEPDCQALIPAYLLEEGKEIIA